MELKTLLKLIHDLLSCGVYYVKDGTGDVAAVSEKIDPNGLFEEFSGAALSPLLAGMEEQTYYELINALGERLFFFRVGEGTALIGPYLKRTIDDREIAERMRKSRVPGQFYQLLKSQYYACAILDPFYIRSTVGACLAAYSGDEMAQYAFVKINRFASPSHMTPPEPSGDELYEHIYAKYEIENELLDKIEHGMVEELKSLLRQLAETIGGTGERSYFNSHPKEAMASLRAMVRVVAVRSGLSIVIVDAILSKYTVLMREARTGAESVQLIEAFQIEMAEEIRRYRTHVPPCSPLLREVTEYILLHYGSPLSLPELARQFRISPSHLSHLFKREIGRSVGEFLEEIRVANACRFLENTDMSVAQVAEAVGYFDNNYFTKVFKKRMQLTPRAYREQSLRA